MMAKHMNNLTSPLNILKHAKIEKLHFNCIAWIATIIASFGLLLLKSQFLLAPGIPIALPEIKTESIISVPFTDIITIGPYDTFFLNDDIFSIHHLTTALTQAIQSKTTPPPYTLLIKTDNQTTMETFLTVASIAQSNGFHAIQIATQPIQETDTLLSQ